MSRATRASRPPLKERLAPRLARAEAAVFRGAMNLPEGVQRRLAGRPVVREGQTLAVDTQLMLRLQKVARKAGAETLDIPDGRLAILEQSALAGGRQPIGSAQDVKVGHLLGRLYTPTSHRPGAPAPLLVFFHGGGFIYGDLDSHDAPCRFLAERSGVRVLAVDYRLAPEEPFPAAYDDCVAAYRWVVANAADLDADPARLAVGGDSAGGNLAAGVAIAAARDGLPLAFQLLIYPMTDARGQAASRQAFGAGFFLTTEFIGLASSSYTPDAATHTDPRVSPLLADIPPGLAPAYLCTAGFDPLRDEGEAFARRLADAGVEVELQRFADQIHGFFNIVGAGRTSRAACAVIAAKLRAALG
ncbi:alpha/beta hydrolase [Nocardioides ferulae]|uniref:alpha/beta hydrolase n=1 Tax=Nocardioides ferulae TaxID=2340821 RepID=UPI000EACC81C|nr:alpha/beta hydrolase [Nocardioides ferulae]